MILRKEAGDRSISMPKTYDGSRSGQREASGTIDMIDGNPPTTIASLPRSNNERLLLILDAGHVFTIEALALFVA